MKRKIFFILGSFFLYQLSFAQSFIFYDDIEIENEYLIDNLLDFSLQQKGVPYKFGGKDSNGFDCSGFVAFVFNEFGVKLPHSSKAMSNIGETIDFENLQKGDLVFFQGRTLNNIVGHVGIVYEINNKNIYFIHASTNSNVTISNLNNEYYYKNRYLFAKKISLN